MARFVITAEESKRLALLIDGSRVVIDAEKDELRFHIGNVGGIFISIRNEDA